MAFGMTDNKYEVVKMVVYEYIFKIGASMLYTCDNINSQHNILRENESIYDSGYRTQVDGGFNTPLGSFVDKCSALTTKPEVWTSSGTCLDKVYGRKCGGGYIAVGGIDHNTRKEALTYLSRSYDAPITVANSLSIPRSKHGLNGYSNITYSTFKLIPENLNVTGGINKIMSTKAIIFEEILWKNIFCMFTESLVPRVGSFTNVYLDRQNLNNWKDNTRTNITTGGKRDDSEDANGIVLYTEAKLIGSVINEGLPYMQPAFLNVPRYDGANSNGGDLILGGKSSSGLCDIVEAYYTSNHSVTNGSDRYFHIVGYNLTARRSCASSGSGLYGGYNESGALSSLETIVETRNEY